jgi:hypothetical protein
MPCYKKVKSRYSVLALLHMLPEATCKSVVRKGAAKLGENKSEVCRVF